MKTLATALIVLLVSSLTIVSAAEPERLYRASVGNDGIQHVELAGGSYYFKPNHIIVKVNVPVELKVIKEEGMTPHNIVLKAPEAGIDIEKPLKGKPQIISFTPTKTGTYHFYCNKKFVLTKSHREKGMEGVLEVVE